MGIFKNRVLESEFNKIKDKIISYKRRDIYDLPCLDLEIRNEVITSTYVYNGKNGISDADDDIKSLESKLSKS
jgi:hypothetical protein